MKTLSLDWQVAVHSMLRRLASASNTLDVLQFKTEAIALLKQAESEYEAQS